MRKSPSITGKFHPKFSETKKNMRQHKLAVSRRVVSKNWLGMTTNSQIDHEK